MERSSSTSSPLMNVRERFPIVAGTVTILNDDDYGSLPKSSVVIVRSPGPTSDGLLCSEREAFVGIFAGYIDHQRAVLFGRLHQSESRRRL